MKTKKKINWVAILIAVAVFFGAKYLGESLVNSDRSSSSSSDKTTVDTAIKSTSNSVSLRTQDLIVLHNVYVLPDTSDIGFRAYAIVYYGSDTHAMTALTLEHVYQKSYGYTLADLKSAGYESDFPSFANISYSETDELAIATIRMTDLKDLTRVQALVDYDIVDLQADQEIAVIDADSYMQSFLDFGWQTASFLDYSFLHFD